VLYKIYYVCFVIYYVSFIGKGDYVNIVILTSHELNSNQCQIVNRETQTCLHSQITLLASSELDCVFKPWIVDRFCSCLFCDDSVGPVDGC